MKFINFYINIIYQKSEIFYSISVFKFLNL
jgi:hypothetical protein